MSSAVTLEVLKQNSGVGFGTSGARGLVSALTDEVCAGYTQAFIHTLQQTFSFDSIAIAIDLRPSSPAIAQACANMTRQMGLNVVFCGAIPTPALALYAQTQRLPGIMVTGSHIPFDRNGLKFYRPDGEITKQDEANMLAFSLVSLHTNSQQTLVEDETAKIAYKQRYLDLFPADIFAGLKLAVYQHSSVARDLIPELLTALGAQVVCLAPSDTFVPIDTEAVAQVDVERGKAWAAQYQVDAIISTDGDADRPLISDEHGKWLRGDIVGLLTAQFLGIQHLAVPVSCNTAIEASNVFEHVVRTRIGSPYVIAGMQMLSQRVSSNIAGFEANGGFLLGAPTSTYPHLASLPTRDAVLPIISVLATSKLNGVSLSKLVAELPSRFTASDRLQNFPTEKSHALLAKWSADLPLLQSSLALPGPIQSVDETDGLRLTLTTGQIVHLRPSGNAPEFRCYVEDANENLAYDLLNRVLHQLSTNS